MYLPLPLAPSATASISYRRLSYGNLCYDRSFYVR